MNEPSLSPHKPPLNVLLANPRGFCAGVERAIQMVEAALDQADGPVFVRHEIVHNRHVVEELETKGAVFVDELSEVPDDATVIFSAHGVAQVVTDEARMRGLAQLDATCPLVSKVHHEAQHHHQMGRHVILIGHAGHPEVEGTMGRVPEGAISLVENEHQAEDIAVADPGKLAYLTQTTLSLDDTAQIVAILKRRFPQITGPNTADICYATTNRQDAVKAIAPRADAILVIGAPNSSNSNRLVEVAQVQGCAHAQLIQRATDIDWQALSGAGTVGITAGASAPEILVQEVLDALGKRFELNLENVTVTEEDVTFSMPKALLG